MTDYTKELKPGEAHPAAYSAREWIAEQDIEWLRSMLGAFASTGLSGNRTSELCAETLARLLWGDTVSDRYVLGLAWTLKELKENEQVG